MRSLSCGEISRTRPSEFFFFFFSVMEWDNISTSQEVVQVELFCSVPCVGRQVLCWSWFGVLGDKYGMSREALPGRHLKKMEDFEVQKGREVEAPASP